MCYLAINIFHEPEFLDFEPAEILERLQKSFLNVLVEPEDPLVVKARSLEKKLAEIGEQGSIVVKDAWRNAKELGPTFAFTIEENKDELIKGRIGRYMVKFEFERSVSKNIRDRLCELLLSLEAGDIFSFDCESGKSIPYISHE